MNKLNKKMNNIFTVARDPEGNLGLFIGFKPERLILKSPNGDEQGWWTSPDDIDDYEVIELPSDMFPDLKWEDDPLELDLVDKNMITKIKEEIKRQMDLNTDGGSNVYNVCTELLSFIDLYSSAKNISTKKDPTEALISELKSYLATTSEEQKRKDWEVIKSLFPGSSEKTKETLQNASEAGVFAISDWNKSQDPDWNGIDPELKEIWDSQNFSTETGDRQMYVDERLLKWIARKSMEYQRKLEYPLCETVNDKIAVYIAGHFITDAVVKTDVNSIVKAMREAVEFGKEEQLDGEIHEVVTKTFSNSQGTYLHVKEGLNMKDGSKLHILIFKENGNY